MVLINPIDHILEDYFNISHSKIYKEFFKFTSNERPNFEMGKRPEQTPHQRRYTKVSEISAYISGIV